MSEDWVITEETKYNFLALIKTLGHPSVRLEKELDLDCSLYNFFLTSRSVRNRYSRTVMLYLLDFGVKCNLSQAVLLKNSPTMGAKAVARGHKWTDEIRLGILEKWIQWAQYPWFHKMVHSF